MFCPDPPYFGSCLCGAVQVRLTALPLLTFACHCRDCQKLTASAYSLNAMFPKGSFSRTGSLTKGGLRSAPRSHYFCASCLTFIYSQIDSAEHRIILRTSILDDASLFAPFVEVMTGDKMPWAKVPSTHSFTRHLETQADLQVLMDAFAKSAGNPP